MRKLKHAKCKLTIKYGSDTFRKISPPLKKFRHFCV